ncbi:hypothetical protein [Methylobacterium persicinum]|uniref:Uncharacterized protein n=1 Tax=Methylobacterium persicinum TaxID=374426 RepID=A0ABU0HLE1_9HYPH|nr:hypothetical protein [Methylobacterium persicinum]MDQ0442737.1 hypothetical protein [Methylobacterium persicinum]GJE37017.1 hypothetical protein KHHGKMAE_1072 [Methylobacterium persicinum]
MRIEAMDVEARGRTGRGSTALVLPIRFAAAAAVIAGIALAVRVPPPRGAMPSLAPPAQAHAILAPAPLRLDEPGIDPVRIEPGRIDPKTGLREDVLGRGSFAAIEAPVLRLAVTRGDGAERKPGLFVLVARRAAHAARGELPLSVLRAGQWGIVPTRFGPAEIAQVTLAGPSTRNCTGFVVARPGLRLDGFLCAPLGGAPEARALACTLDALDLDDPADPAATALFRQSGSNSACASIQTSEADPAGKIGSIALVKARTKN